MLFKKLDDITLEDIQALVDNSVSESKFLDYKEALSGGSDKDKKEFLADIISFANTAGGHLIYGVQENEGSAVNINGIESDDIDELVRIFDAAIQSGIEPRIEHAIKPLSLGDGKFVLIVEIKNSWLKPHRILFKHDDSFWARNSAGKYRMDINEIRKQFLLGYEIEEKITQFREKRVAEIVEGKTYYPMKNTAKVVLHLLPFESFSSGSGTAFSAVELFELAQAVHCSPMRAMAQSSDFNLQGVVYYSSNTDRASCYSYLQIHRNGTIEAACEELLDNERKIIYSESYEKELISSVRDYASLLKKSGLNCPIFICISFVGVLDYKLGVGRGVDFSRRIPLVSVLNDALLLPNAVLNSYDNDISKILKPIFDVFWNCFGYAKSLNYDANDNWIGQH